MSGRRWIGLRRVLVVDQSPQIDHVLRLADSSYEQVPRMRGRFFRHVTGFNTSSSRREQARPRRRILHQALHARHLLALEGFAATRAGESVGEWLSRGWVGAADFRVLGIRTVLDMLFGRRWESECSELERLVDLRQVAFERAGAAPLPWTPAALLPRWRSRALERRFESEADRVQPGAECILGWLADAGDQEETREEALSLTWSGRIGVARTLAWSVVEIAADEAVLEEAVAEARSGREATPYLEGIVRETLRLHPPLPRVLRVAETDSSLPGGEPVPRGSTVSLSLADAHRDPALFPDPQCFRPERFLEAAVDRRSFVVFGAGSRICPGRALAIIEMVTLLRELLRRGRPASLPGGAPPGRGARPPARRIGLIAEPSSRVEPSTVLS